MAAPLAMIQPMMAKRFSPYAKRNAAPILEVLRCELSEPANVLEIGSGSGQHAVYFAREMPGLVWQTSDLENQHATISEWIADSGLGNVAEPIRLDLLSNDAATEHFDAIYSANTAHIVSLEGVRRMFEIARDSLRQSGLMLLYGPFSSLGQFNSPSNAEFDRSLRSRDQSMGIRDIEVLDALANEHALQRQRSYAMPANNQIVVWGKE